MPSVFSCSAGWFEEMMKGQERVVVAAWSEKESGKINEWLEKLQKFEDEGIPVFVVDTDSCPAIAEKLGVKEGGETIVYQRGQEKGRITPTEDFEAELGKVKKLTE